MAQLFKFVLLIFIFFLNISISYASLSGSVEYKIPIEYSKLNEEELNAKADFYYNKALKTTDRQLNDDISHALILYNALSNKNPNNITYALRVGSLYDILGKDRYAKGNYYKALGINPSRPEPYFYLGEFYFKRQHYRKALKMYKKACANGYSEHALTRSRLEELSLILGDKKIAK